jgi:hypothetical protein
MLLQKAFAAVLVLIGTSLAVAACADIIGLREVPDVADATEADAGDSTDGGEEGAEATIEDGGGLADAVEQDGAAGPEPVADAAPVCPVDSICTMVGPTCNANATAVVQCDRNGNFCLYQAASSPCTNGACTGDAGSATCCTNACTASACLPTTNVEVKTCSMGNGCMASGVATCTANLVCERFGTAACVDPSWAEWPMPNNTTADPGSPNAMSYQDNGDGTVTDEVTALIWQKGESSSTCTWGSVNTSGTAQNYCATLSLAGYSWRLPSIEELVSIVDPGASSPRINLTYFPGTPNSLFWSSTAYATSSSDAWAVSMYDTSGVDHGAFSVSTAGYVRCVH